jgi:hypothetical protein
VYGFYYSYLQFTLEILITTKLTIVSEIDVIRVNELALINMTRLTMQLLDLYDFEDHSEENIEVLE